MNFLRTDYIRPAASTALLTNTHKKQGGLLDDATFCFDSIHFHWGDNNKTKKAPGSEHKINGKQFPMELHFIFWDCLNEPNISVAIEHSIVDHTQGQKDSDGYKLAVISVLFEIGEWRRYF